MDAPGFNCASGEGIIYNDNTLEMLYSVNPDTLVQNKHELNRTKHFTPNPITVYNSNVLDLTFRLRHTLNNNSTLEAVDYTDDACWFFKPKIRIHYDTYSYYRLNNN